jgi:hypothetical protein
MILSNAEFGINSVKSFVPYSVPPSINGLLINQKTSTTTSLREPTIKNKNMFDKFV